MLLERKVRRPALGAGEGSRGWREKMPTGTGTWEGNLSSASSQATLDSPGQSMKAHEVSRQLQVRAHPTGTERGRQSSSHPRWASGGLDLIPDMVMSEYCNWA